MVLLLIPTLLAAQPKNYLPSIPDTLSDKYGGPPRPLARSFAVKVNSQDYLVTAHSAEDQPGAFSVWRHSSQGYLLVQRLDDTEYSDATPVYIGGRSFVFMVGCERHCQCAWSLARMGADGHLTELKIPDIRQPEVLRPGEELFGLTLKERSALSFLAFVCLPNRGPCWLGDSWEADEAWGSSGPQVIEGRFKIQGNALKVAEIHRRRFDRDYPSCSPH